jgi:hypothetical protein
LLKCVHKRRQIADVAANHGQIPSRHMPNVIRPRRDVEKSYFIASLKQLFCRVRTNQTRAGNEYPHFRSFVAIFLCNTFDSVIYRSSTTG